MKKLLKSTTVAAITLLLANAAHAADFVMKIAMTDAETTEDERHYGRTPLRGFAKEVEEKSGGRIDVQIFWGGQLGKIENVMNMVRQGQVEAVFASDGQVAPFYPDIQILGVPYLFVNRQVAYEVLDGEAGTTMAESMAEKAGLRPLGWLENGGYRHYSTNKKVETPDDMAGLKIRTMNNDVHMNIVSALGASPTPIPWADVYTSLQTGVVDGQENSLSTFRVPRFEEVQKYIILDGHVYGILLLVASEKWLESLPADLRAVVDEATKNMVTLNREISLESETLDRKYLEEYGVEITEPSIETIKKFQEMTQAPVLEKVKNNVDPGMLKLFEEKIAEAEAKL